MSTLRNSLLSNPSCSDAIDRNAHAIALLGDNIFYFGELGMQEFRGPPKLMTGLLEQAGFKVERGISGFPTGFCATMAQATLWSRSIPNTTAVPTTRKPPRARAALHRRRRTRPLRRPQRQRPVLGRDCDRARQAMERFGLKGTLKVFGGPRRSSSSADRISCATAVRRRRRCVPQPYRCRVRVELRLLQSALISPSSLSMANRACRTRPGTAATRSTASC